MRNVKVIMLLCKKFVYMWLLLLLHIIAISINQPALKFYYNLKKNLALLILIRFISIL